MNGFFAGFALALLLWFAAFLFLKAYVRRRTSPDHILALLQEEVLQLEADIDEKTEQTLQLLEERIDSLREICTEAERRIDVYARELEKREKESQSLAVLKKAPLVERLEVQTQNQNSLASMPNISFSSEPPLVIKPRPIKERIAELHQAGFAPELIAKRLRVNLGEVNLHINL